MYKMGGKSSRQSQTPSLQEEAAINFHNRIKKYDYVYHGPYHEYLNGVYGTSTVNMLAPALTSQPIKRQLVRSVIR